MKAHFKLFSDGASFNNGRKNKDLPQFASCAYVLTLNEKILVRKAIPLGDATISVAELTGAYESFKHMYEKCLTIPEEKLHKPYKITLYSDSEYVVKGFEERMENWKRNDWCTKAGSPVANVELWKKLYNIKQNKDLILEMIHIKAHTNKQDFGSRMNDIVDKLAVEEVKKWKSEMNLK